MSTPRYLPPLALSLAIGLAACGGSSSRPAPVEPEPDPVEPVPEQPVEEERVFVPLTAPFADYGTVMNILPPGQDDGGGLANLAQDIPGISDLLNVLLNDVVGETGLLPALSKEPHFDDQLDLYENLVFSEPGLTAEQLSDFFKPAPLLAADAGNWTREYVVTSDERRVDIKRDDFGVPHIYGDNRADALFGMGYVTAEDRLFLLDVLRRGGRGRLSEFLGPADFSFDIDIADNAPYREEDLTRQIAQLPSNLGADGAQIVIDAQNFVDGLNKYVEDAQSGLLEVPLEYLGLGVNLQPFVPEDVVAIATLIQGIFAGGGGGEHRNVLLLHALHEQTGDARQACDLWRDLRHANDPEASVTTTLPFATQSPARIDEDACPLLPEFAGTFNNAVMFDAGSFNAYEPLDIRPCGRPGQDDCPGGLQGSIPGLPGVGVIEGTSERLLDVIRGLFSLSSSDRSANDSSLWASAKQWLSSSIDTLLGRTPEATPATLSEAQIAAAQEKVRMTLAQLQQLGDSVPQTMSNALLVNAEHSASGHPLAVFGPQTSYFAPQLLLEMAVHGGDLNTRGMTFTGLPYVVIGRGPDFAWSATSGNSDLTDVRALRLCQAADGEGYLFNGECVAFDIIEDSWSARWNVAVPFDDPADAGQNFAVNRRVIRAPDYGPVLGFATANGQPIALARQRTTYFAELDTALPFLQATRNDVFDAQSFREIFKGSTGSFNWFYADADDITFIHAGLYPQRAMGVHPELPSWGDGSADWQGFLPLEALPQETNPPRGYLASWNNRPAVDWWSSDNNATYQLVHRNDMLDTRLQALVAQGNVTLAALTEAMADAGVVDLRGQEIAPVALDLLESGTLSADQQMVIGLMRDWVAGQAFRRDRNNSGEYDDTQAVAFMDAWYTRMIEQLLPQVTALESSAMGNVVPVGRDNSPGDMGSAYQSGYYGYLARTLQMAQGTSTTPYRVLRCADSDNAAQCRTALITAFDQAIDDLGGVEAMDSWRADPLQDAIIHRPIGLAGVRPTHWQNRPTYQQIVEFNRRR